jgi:glycosyltransferase involved in cell wall biosynthesis
LVVPPAQPKAIALAVKKLLEDPDLARNLSVNGRKYALKNFDPNKNTRKIEEIYLKIIANSE